MLTDPGLALSLTIPWITRALKGWLLNDLTHHRDIHLSVIFLMSRSRLSKVQAAEAPVNTADIFNYRATFVSNYTFRDLRSAEGVRVPVNGVNADVILTSAVEGQGFVSIDGKRTYLNLFENSDRTSTHVQPQPQPTRTQQPAIVGTGLVPDEIYPPRVNLNSPFVQIRSCPAGPADGDSETGWNHSKTDVSQKADPTPGENRHLHRRRHEYL